MKESLVKTVMKNHTENTALSDDGFDLVEGYSVLGCGSRNGTEEQGFTKEDFFLLLLGILKVDLYNVLKNN